MTSWIRVRSVAYCCILLCVLLSGTLAAEKQLVIRPARMGADFALDDPLVVRSRAVAIGPEDVPHLESGDRLSLDLFADAELAAVVDRVTNRSGGGYTAVGHLAGEPDSTFIMVTGSGVTTAEIRSPSQRLHYQIRPVAGGLHSVRQIDDNKYLPCGIGQEHEVLGPAARGEVAAPLIQECIEDGSVIDVLVVYTPAARDGAGGTAAMEALIDLAIADTNQAYANSLIDTQVRLVHQAEVAYDESGSQLGALTDPADGIMDEVHALRDAYNADMVSLLVSSASYCGIAWVMQDLSADFQSHAFSVTVQSCIGNLTFAHELGHNQGCAHDRANAGASGLFTYSYGYQDPGEAFRTVMSYNCPGGCPRVLHFSNPDVFYNGLSTGVPIDQPDSAHNALTINQSAQTVACFRNADCNGNGVPDPEDIANGTSEDCSGNGIPDECEPDCNQNGLADSCDIFAGTSEDCDANRVPDECEPYADCNGNGAHDPCDVLDGLSEDCNHNWIPDECLSIEADCNSNLKPDACDLSDGTSEDCNQNTIPDECDILAGTSGDCNGDGVPDECEPECDGNGIPDICDIAEGRAPDEDGNGVPDMCEAAVLYVDASATGLAYGISWTNAFVGLQDALEIAANPANATEEIWVAAGSYAPSKPTDFNDPRTATFQLLSGLALYGGFAGGETARGQRDPANNSTYLTGDLGGNDVGDSGREENAYHVVTSSGTDTTAVLDGFLITSGNADGDYPHYHGAGLFNWSGSPRVAHCTFSHNEALNNGGAAFIWGGSMPLFTACTFSENRAVEGGAIHNHWYAQPTFSDCLFLANETYSSSSLFGGGAVSNAYSCQPYVVNCTFVGNSNEASNGGGGLLAEFESAPIVRNSIFWANSAAGVQNEAAQIVLRSQSTVAISYSCVQGWSGLLGGVGNTGAIPSFADPFGPDNVPGTVDDDVRLSADSPCIDAANSGNVFQNEDLDGGPRRVDILGVPDTGAGSPPIVDMGCYEYHADCNSNGIADEDDIAQGTGTDCNQNGVLDECEGTYALRGFSLSPVSATGNYSLLDVCNEIVVEPGARLALELNVGGWDPDLDGGPRLSLYGAGIDTTGFTSGVRGSLNPLRIACSSDADCRGRCATDGYCDHQSSVYVDTANPDWVYFGIAGTFGGGTPGFALAGLVFNYADSVVDTGTPKYGGSLVLDVSSDAAGTFTVELDPSSGNTLMADETGQPLPIIHLIPARIRIATDCNLNGRSDLEDVALGFSADCNGNDFPDECDIVNDVSSDCDGNIVPDECQPDCDADGIHDPCEIFPSGAESDCNANAIPDNCDITGGSSDDCNTNAVPDECESDCNYNSIPDDCDLTSGSSQDSDGNGIPDECDLAPVAAGYGARMLQITPAPGDQPVSLALSAPAHACLNRYLAADGALVDTPVARLPAEWGTVYVGGREIVPGTDYHVQADRGDLLSAPAPGRTARWGDTVGTLGQGGWTPPDGVVNLSDILGILQRFAHADSAPPMAWVDIAPEVPDGRADLQDISGVLQAFAQLPYPYGPPCP